MTKVIGLILVLSTSSMTHAFQAEKTWDEVFGIPKPIEKSIDDCEATVRDLSAVSETMDRAGKNASEKTQLWFTNSLTLANSCAAKLTKRTGKKYKVSKDWFGSGYTLKKP